MYKIEDLVADIAEGKEIFPLQTRKSLSKRWGVSRQVVTNWAIRDPDFPLKGEGIVEAGRHGNTVYPLYTIQQYEKDKGLKVVDQHNKTNNGGN